MAKNFDDQKTAPAGTDFWAWANDVYARPGVADSLISGQDNAGLNVNMMLWACWSATAFDDIPESAMRSAMGALAEWSDTVTAPLRAARRGAKPFEGQSGFQKAAALRNAIKSAELDAERIEIEILEDLAALYLTPSSEGGVKRRARRNLAQYATLAGARKHDGFSAALLHRVIDNIFAPPQNERNPQECDGS